MNQLSQVNQNQQMLQQWEIMMPNNNLNPSNPSISQQTDQSDFIKIEQITTQLKRLHVFGEIFAENGYLVRSDERSKTDIQTIENALHSITSLVGKKYAYKNEPGKTKYGFIAQEVEEAIPELVQRDGNGNLSVDYLGIIPYIVEALKTIHENSISLESTSRQEFIELAKKVEDAVEQLQSVMEQHGKTLFIEKESKVSKLITFDIFGPPLMVLLMAIMFSIFSIIIPFFVPYMFFTLGTMIVTTIILWTVVIAQRKQLKEFMYFKHLRMKWMPSQFFVWFIIFTIIHISILVSIILGYGGLIMTAVYLIFFSILAVLMGIGEVG